MDKASLDDTVEITNAQNPALGALRATYSTIVDGFFCNDYDIKGGSCNSPKAYCAYRRCEEKPVCEKVVDGKETARSVANFLGIR